VCAWGHLYRFHKLGKTGSKAQLYNGFLLLASFAGSRLVWGSYQSALIYSDVWQAWHTTEHSTAQCLKFAEYQQRGAGLDIPVSCRSLPAWLAILYVGANTALSVLNFYWFWKMVKAVRKRFEPSDERDVRAMKRGKDLANGDMKKAN